MTKKLCIIVGCVLTLVSFAFLPGCAGADSEMARSANRIELIGSDLSAFRGDTGDWEIVGAAVQDPDDEKKIAGRGGTGVAMSANGRTVALLTKQQFGDIRAHIEFMIPKESNSGVYFMGRYEIQIYDSYGVEKDKYPGIECGGIYERWERNRTPQGFEGYSPLVNVSRPPGQWQSFDVKFRAPRFDNDGNKIANARFEEVRHNDVVVHKSVELTGPTRGASFADEQPTGPLMFQGDHGPIAYRNIWIVPLDR